MVIQTGKVSMESTHKIVTYQGDFVSYTSWGIVLGNLGNTVASTLPSAKDSEQISAGKDISSIDEKEQKKKTREELLEQLNQKSKIAETKLFVQEDDGVYEGETKVEYNALKNLMMLLFGQRELSTEKVSTETIFSRLLAEQKERLAHLLGGMGMLVTAPSQAWGEELNITSLYQEKESTTFTTTGTIKTEDGRSISFDVSAVMSRSYTSYTEISINYGAARMIDPLVICLSSEPAGLRDKKFLFDIDADGSEDNISLLARNCGFLALDHNKDGIINDGSELFGTKTGDGFTELAVFDFDGNGWIDEKDEIFNHLKIWTKDDDGNDKLIGLGIAGIGAIYLGNVSTEFSLNSTLDNIKNGAVRKTGVYLTEEGEAKLIQHIDFTVT